MNQLLARSPCLSDLQPCVCQIVSVDDFSRSLSLSRAPEQSCACALHEHLQVCFFELVHETREGTLGTSILPDKDFGHPSFMRRWTHHPELAATTYSLRVIKSRRPCSGILENVKGMAEEHFPGQKPPIAWVKQELEDAGFFCQEVRTDLLEWHEVVRQRTCCCLLRPWQLSVRAQGEG